jgi:Domain of unknown function (DUF6431)
VREPLKHRTVSLIPCSGDDCKPGFDWAVCAGQITRQCPSCGAGSIESLGWRPKQAHDNSHDWIRYRRGECQICRVTVSFLPAFSLPYTHYSLVARSEAVRLRFVEGCSWEDAAPPLKDPDRVPAPSTLRRWCHSLDSSPAFSFLYPMLQAVAQWMASGEQPAFGSLHLSWSTFYSCLRVVWPWPLRL